MIMLKHFFINIKAVKSHKKPTNPYEIDHNKRFEKSSAISVFDCEGLHLYILWMTVDIMVNYLFIKKSY